MLDIMEEMVNKCLETPNPSLEIIRGKQLYSVSTDRNVE